MSIMYLIGCDFHPSFQTIAVLNLATGEVTEHRLRHADGEAKRFYESLEGRALVGMEASGSTLWFERLLAKLGHELWIGDAATIRAKEMRKQKTDRRDAQLSLTLLREGRFPRIWVPSLKERDLRQLLMHRHNLVRMRTRVKNQLQHIALSQGLQLKRSLWTKAGMEGLTQLELEPWTRLRRDELLVLLAELNAKLAPLDEAVKQEAEAREAVQRLMGHSGVGPLLGLATVLTMGPVERFADAKRWVSYLGLNPREHSSGGRQKLGSISKQGSSFMRFLLVQGARSAARRDPELGRVYARLAQKKHRGVAIVAVARRLAVRLYWILRRDTECSVGRMQGSPSHPVVEVRTERLSGPPASQG